MEKKRKGCEISLSFLSTLKFVFRLHQYSIRYVVCESENQPELKVKNISGRNQLDDHKLGILIGRCKICINLSFINFPLRASVFENFIFLELIVLTFCDIELHSTRPYICICYRAWCKRHHFHSGQYKSYPGNRGH